MKKLSIILCVIGIIFMVSFFISKKNINCQVSLEGERWNVEIAKTPEARTAGLMNRRELCETCGMLFVFDENSPKNFWMKNTRIPLDIYFYDDSGRLVDAVANMRPEKETGKPMEYTSRPAQYVFEVVAGSRFQSEIFDPRECL